MSSRLGDVGRKVDDLAESGCQMGLHLERRVKAIEKSRILPLPATTQNPMWAFIRRFPKTAFLLGLIILSGVNTIIGAVVGRNVGPGADAILRDILPLVRAEIRNGMQE